MRRLLRGWCWLCGDGDRSIGFSLACLSGGNCSRRAARSGVTPIRRPEHGIDDLSAVERDKIVHAARLLAAVPIEQIGEALERPRGQRLAQLGDDLRLGHTWIDGGDLRFASTSEKRGGERGDNNETLHVLS